MEAGAWGRILAMGAAESQNFVKLYSDKKVPQGNNA